MTRLLTTQDVAHLVQRVGLPDLLRRLVGYLEAVGGLDRGHHLAGGPAVRVVEDRRLRHGVERYRARARRGRVGGGAGYPIRVACVTRLTHGADGFRR